MEKIILDRIKSNKSIALLAPSFPIDFDHPNIIGMLRSLGFDEVTELTFGARMVNWWYVEHIKKNPDQAVYIASPCPTIVSYIENKYPNLKKYLMPYASPMLAMAKIIKYHRPDIYLIFISPCYAKQQIEAPKCRESVDGVITFKDLKALFEEEGIFSHDYNREYKFDSLIQEYTKIYPISGGLAKTSHISKFFKKEEIFIDEGLGNIEPVLKEISEGKSNYKFLDLLNCKGGCIGGPAIINQQMSMEERKLKVKNYLDKESRNSMGSHRGRLEYAEGVDFKVKL